MSGTADDAHTGAPVEIDEGVVRQVSAICLTLPEVTPRVDVSLSSSRSTAHSFEIRGRSFCLLVARRGPGGGSRPLLVMRADPEERDALLAIGRPYFAPRAGPGRIGVWLTEATDWDEMRELVTESYRRLAPKKLTARLDDQRRP